MATYEERKNKYDEELATFREGYRAYKAQTESAKAQKIGKAITSRVNTWIENNNNYIYNFNTRYSAGNSDYRDDSETWLSTITEQKARFDREAENIKSLLNQYQGSLDADYVSSVIKALDDNRAQQEKIVSMSAADRDFWANFDSAEDYKKYKAGWLNTDSGVDAQTAALRSDLYEEYQKRLAALDEELPWYAGGVLPNFAENIFLSSENEKKRDEMERLKAETKQYERTQGVLDDYYAEETPEFLESAAKRDYHNATREELEAYDISERDGSIALSNGGYYDDEGNIRDAKGNVIHSAAVPAVEDKLGMFLSSDDNDLVEAYNKLIQTNGNYSDTWADLMQEGDKNSWRYLTDHEINIYYDLYNREGQESAYHYLDLMTPVLTQRSTKATKEDIENAKGIAQIGLNIASVPMNIFGGLASFIDDTMNVMQGEDINPYSRAHAMSNAASDIRGKTASDIEKATGGAALPWLGTTFGDVYQSLMSAADSAVGIFLGGNAYGVLMGTGAASSTAKDLYEKGASPGQIVAGGLLAGAAEMVCEKWSIDKLVKMKDPKRIRDVIINTLKQGGVEASEEATTELANTIANYLVMGSESDVKDTETFIKNLVNAAIGGFLSGGMIGGASSAVNNAVYQSEVKKYGKKLIEQNAVDSLKASAQTFSENKEINRLLEKVNKKTNGKTVGALGIAVRNATNVRDHAEIKNVLVESGLSEKEAQTVTDFFMRVRDGYQPSDAEIQYIEKITDKLPDVAENVKQNAELMNTATIAIENQSQPQTVTNSPTPAETPDTDAISQSADGKTVRKDTGEEIAIQEIASAKDGEVMLRLEGGETVNVKDVEFGSDDEAVMYEIAGEMNAAVANAMIHGYKADAGLSMVDYARGFHEAYTYGYYGYPMAEMSQEGFSVDLSDEMKTYAYQLGRSSRDARIAEKKNKMASSDHENPISDNKNAGLHLEFDKNDVALTEREEVSLSALEVLSKALGVNIYVYESKTDKNGKRIGANGYYDADGIHIDLYAGQNGNGTMLFTAAHELTHFIREWSPEKFKIFADFLFEQYGANGVSVSELVARQKEKAAENGRVLDTDAAYEEVVADACETMLTDSDAIEKIRALYEKDKTLFEKIKEFFADLIAKIKKAYKDLSPDSLEASLVHDMKETAEELHRLWTDALLDAAGNHVEDNSTDTNTHYSFRGTNAEGIEVYETSEEIKKLPVKERQKAFLDIMTEQYQGRTAKFIRNGHTYYAKFEESDINKNIYGDKRSDSKGWKAKINIGAEGNIFELVENARYSGSKAEQGKKIAAHKGVGYWDYFIKTVQIDNRIYNLLANVRRKADNSFVYSIQLRENKKTEASPSLGSLLRTSNRMLNASNDSISQENDSVKDEKKTSDRDSDGIGFSNRSLLANALESVAQNDVEKETLAKYKSKIAEMEAQEAKLFEIRERIKNLYADVKSSQDLTFKFDSKKELTNLRIEAQKIVNRLNIYDRQLLELEASKTLKDLLARERGAAYSKAKKKANERRNKTMMKEKIRGVLRNLDKLLLNPTKEHHIPNGLRKPVAEALTLINRELAQAADDTIANAKKRIQLYDWRLDNYEKYAKSTQNPLTKEELITLRDNAMTRAEKRKLKIDSMLDAYNELKNSSDPILRGAFDENVVSLIEQVKQDVGDKALGDMSLKQLEDVYQMYRAIQKNIREANKAFKTQRNETISSLADKTIRELSAYDKKEYVLKALEALKKVGWDMLKPEYAMRLIGSDTLLSLWHEVRAGEDVWATDVNEAKAFVEKQKKSHHYDEWDLKTKHEFSTQSGKRFVLAVPQMMSLYAYSKRAQADEHLKLGGFVFDEAIEVTEKKHGIPIKYKVNTAYAHTISKDTIAEITAALTKDQRDFVDEMQEYLSSVMGEKGNEVTRALYDIDLFKEKFYFPLKSAEQFLYEQNTPVGEQKIKNFGFTKKTIQNANNPIILSNFMDVWAGHVIDMSMYHAFTLPLEDFNRVFNYNTPVGKGQDTESVKSHIQTVFGAQAVGYVKTLLTDLNGGARTDNRTGLLNKGISLSKKAAVTASLSVAIQQPSAVMRAMALVAPQHFIGLPKLIPKKTWSEIKKYAPVAIIKEMGGFDTGMGKSTVDWLIGEKSLMDRIDDITGFLPSYADEVTWCNIWIAVKKEIRASKKYAENSEEFMQAAGKRFTEVITRTQVYDSVLSRSGLMRSRDTGAKMLTMFMAEPTVTMNMTVDALIQGKRGKGAAIGMVLRTLSACTAANIVNSVLVSLIYAARDDDEDETYLEKYLASLTSELIDSFNPLTYLPIVRDIWSIMQGYDIERSDMSLISDVWGAVENLWSDKKSVSEKIMGVVGTLSAFLGLPIKNIERDVKAVLNSFTTMKGTTKAGVAKAVSEAAKDAIPLLGRFSEDKSRTTMLYEAYFDGDKAQIARMEHVYKNDADAIASALRTGLRENDPRIQKATEAELRGDPRGRVSIVREIIGEGHFSQDIVVTAVTAEAENVKSNIRKAAEAKLHGKTEEHDKLLKALLEKYPKDLIEKLAGEKLDDLMSEGTEEKTEDALSFYKPSDVNAAFDSGDYALAGEIIDDLIKTKMANGKDESAARSSVKSAMTSYWKPFYKAAHEAGDTEEMTRIREILRESDLYGNSNDIRKTVNRWLEDEEN